MFTLQQSQIASILTRGGLLPDAAAELASVLGNCMATLAHRGPVTLDYTPPAFNFVTPELRKFQFPSMDSQSLNPDYQPSGGDYSETGNPPTDAPITEPQDARPGFGPSADPDGSNGGAGAIGPGGIFVFPPGPPAANPQPQPFRVVHRLFVDPASKRWMVEYATILCWPIQRWAPQEWCVTKEIEVIDDLFLGPDKIYSKKHKIRVPVRQELPQVDELPATECS